MRFSSFISIYGIEYSTHLIKNCWQSSVILGILFNFHFISSSKGSKRIDKKTDEKQALLLLKTLWGLNKVANFLGTTF